MNRFVSTPVLRAALAAALLGGGGPAPAQMPVPTTSATPATAFSGRAFVASAQTLGIATVTLSDTGPLPQSGGCREASLATAEIPGLLSAEAAHASTIGQGDRSRSEASLANVNVTAAGATIRADFLMARAMAVCTPEGPATSGSADAATLVVNGQTILISGQPNQTVALPVGRLVLNERTSAGPGDITVNALHLTIPGTADIILSSAHADVVCFSPPVCQGNDFITGGGWITGTPTGAKGTFGVAGGLVGGQFWGHLTYVDHGSGMVVKGTGVTAYQVTGPTSRRIEGTAEINGKGGYTYRVEVSDNGEPGTSDTFTLDLSDGYHASGTLAGGNIQLHTPCH